ncbi:alpha/beta hydrolase [Pseudonocardia sp. RS11V-5]|uniref:alpha/beta fold hydrolase n=1 Tax=Pseudonocardia terrae TaxID=2905831 RepID=UPI001E2DA0A1|nr:alpha/beta fold hydrolase [Pseudonocardia terrae]MCE3552772.1 alpha/beta hydrolase [Pseudonocardia terrae]
MTDATAPDGARIHADVAGEGEPLVLLAGQANSHHWWDPIRADFAGFCTIAVDTLGTGESTAPWGAEYSTRRFTRDVVAVLDALGVARAHVYGTSMGGKIAQWLAIDHPQRVGALVLGCTTTGGPDAPVAGKDVVGPLAGPAAVAQRALAELMFTPAWLAEHPGPYSVLGDDGMISAARRGHRRASAQHDAREQVSMIIAPTLVVHGTEDLFCPTANGAELAERIPDAALHLVEAARHAYFEEFRAEATPLVLGFLREHALS